MKDRLANLSLFLCTKYLLPHPRGKVGNSGGEEPEFYRQLARAVPGECGGFVFAPK